MARDSSGTTIPKQSDQGAAIDAMNKLLGEKLQSLYYSEAQFKYIESKAKAKASENTQGGSKGKSNRRKGGGDVVLNEAQFQTAVNKLKKLRDTWNKQVFQCFANLLPLVELIKLLPSEEVAKLLGVGIDIGDEQGLREGKYDSLLTDNGFGEFVSVMCELRRKLANDNKSFDQFLKENTSSGDNIKSLLAGSEKAAQGSLDNILGKKVDGKNRKGAISGLNIQHQDAGNMRYVFGVPFLNREKLLEGLARLGDIDCEKYDKEIKVRQMRHDQERKMEREITGLWGQIEELKGKAGKLLEEVVSTIEPPPENLKNPNDVLDYLKRRINEGQDEDLRNMIRYHAHSYSTRVTELGNNALSRMGVDGSVVRVDSDGNSDELLYGGKIGSGVKDSPYIEQNFPGLTADIVRRILENKRYIKFQGHTVLLEPTDAAVREAVNITADAAAFLRDVNSQTESFLKSLQEMQNSLSYESDTHNTSEENFREKTEKIREEMKEIREGIAKLMEEINAKARDREKRINDLCGNTVVSCNPDEYYWLETGCAGEYKLGKIENLANAMSVMSSAMSSAMSSIRSIRSIDIYGMSGVQDTHQNIQMRYALYYVFLHACTQYNWIDQNTSTEIVSALVNLMHYYLNNEFGEGKYRSFIGMLSDKQELGKLYESTKCSSAEDFLKVMELLRKICTSAKDVECMPHYAQYGMYTIVRELDLVIKELQNKGLQAFTSKQATRPHEAAPGSDLLRSIALLSNMKDTCDVLKDRFESHYKQFKESMRGIDDLYKRVQGATSGGGAPAQGDAVQEEAARADGAWGPTSAPVSPASPVSPVSPKPLERSLEQPKQDVMPVEQWAKSPNAEPQAAASAAPEAAQVATAQEGGAAEQPSPNAHSELQKQGRVHISGSLESRMFERQRVLERHGQKLIPSMWGAFAGAATGVAAATATEEEGAAADRLKEEKSGASKRGGRGSS